MNGEKLYSGVEIATTPKVRTLEEEAAKKPTFKVYQKQKKANGEELVEVGVIWENENKTGKYYVLQIGNARYYGNKQGGRTVFKIGGVEDVLLPQMSTNNNTYYYLHILKLYVFQR